MFKKLMSVPTSKLFMIASVGGVIACSAGLLSRFLILQELRKSEYYRLAVTNFMAHEPLVEFMGKPIYFGNADLGNTNINFSTLSEAQFEIPVQGANHKGAMHFQAVRNAEDETSKWELAKLEVSVEQRPLDRVRVPITFSKFAEAVKYVEDQKLRQESHA